MRVLSWFVVFCLVTVSGAGRTGASAASSWAAAIGPAAPASAHLTGLRTALDATTPRARAAERPRHAPPPLLLAALAPGWSPPVPPRGILAPPVSVPERVFTAPARTGSARGPPLV